MEWATTGEKDAGEEETTTTTTTKGNGYNGLICPGFTALPELVFGIFGYGFDRIGLFGNLLLWGGMSEASIYLELILLDTRETSTR